MSVPIIVDLGHANPTIPCHYQQIGNPAKGVNDAVLGWLFGFFVEVSVLGRCGWFFFITAAQLFYIIGKMGLDLGSNGLGDSLPQTVYRALKSSKINR